MALTEIPVPQAAFARAVHGAVLSPRSRRSVALGETTVALLALHGSCPFERFQISVHWLPKTRADGLRSYRELCLGQLMNGSQQAGDVAGACQLILCTPLPVLVRVCPTDLARPGQLRSNRRPIGNCDPVDPPAVGPGVDGRNTRTALVDVRCEY
jgi:hypothetical protein